MEFDHSERCSGVSLGPSGPYTPAATDGAIFEPRMAIQMTETSLFFKKYRFSGSTSTAGSYQSRDPINKVSTVPER